MLDRMPVDVDRRRFTVDEYQRMGDAGVFSEKDRVELIDGEILTMSPIGSAHCAVVDRANRALVLAAHMRAIVRVQGPIGLSPYTEPQPDLVLLRPRGDFYGAGHPRPADVLLVIEIADSSLRYDREVKALLYARSGIVEYWLVDLTNHSLTRYTTPENGTYHNVSIHEHGQVLAPSALPDCSIAINDLLGEPSEGA
jgi:Uma2 family endonuclease